MRTILSLNLTTLCRYNITKHAREYTQNYFQHRYQAHQMPSKEHSLHLSKENVQKEIMQCLAKDKNFPCAAIQQTDNSVHYVFRDQLQSLFDKPINSGADAFPLMLRSSPHNNMMLRPHSHSNMINAVAGAAVSVAAAGALAHAYKKKKFKKSKKSKKFKQEELRF